MTITVTHQFNCSVPDDPAAAALGEVLPSHWNASHVVSGTVTGTPTQIAYFGAGGELTGDAALTFDSGTGTLAAAAVQVGSTPFTFLESAGVLQLGDGSLTWDSAGKSLKSWITNDGANYRRINLDVTYGYLALAEEAGYGAFSSTYTTGISQDVPQAGTFLYISNGLGGWYMNNSADTAPNVLYPGGNNTQDFGSVTASTGENHQVRTGYFGTSVVVDPSGSGFVDAAAYKVGGTPGLASFSGAVTNITVVNGIVTAAS